MYTHEELLNQIKNEAKRIGPSFIESDEEKRRDWINSDFSLVKDILNPRIRGEAMIALALKFIRKSEYPMDPDSKHNSTQTAKINKKLIQIKTSSLWRGGFYKFQQIRRTDKFDLLFCFGISPGNVHCWIIERYLIINDIGFWEDFEGLENQHANEETTRWLKVNPKNVADSLKPWGGELDVALEGFKNALRR